MCWWSAPARGVLCKTKDQSITNPTDRFWGYHGIWCKLNMHASFPCFYDHGGKKKGKKGEGEVNQPRRVAPRSTPPLLSRRPVHGMTATGQASTTPYTTRRDRPAVNGEQRHHSRHSQPRPGSLPLAAAALHLTGLPAPPLHLGGRPQIPSAVRSRCCTWLRGPWGRRSGRSISTAAARPREV